MIRAMKSALLAALAAFLLSASPAYPGPASHPGGACLPTGKVREILAKRYGEYPAIIGTTGRGQVMIFYANPVKRTWSIVVYTRSGLGCLIQSGGGVNFGKAKPKGKPA